MPLTQNAKIILASTSPIRKKILEEAQIKFDIIAPDFDEEIAKSQNKNLSIKELTLLLARGKALSISRKFPKDFVIGSDQICEFAGKKFDKSKNADEAFAQLKAMSGNSHFQNNAVIIAKNNKIIFKKFTKVELKMRKISDEEILSYIESDQPFGSAGSYKYESLGKHLFAKIKGDYYSVLGLNIQAIIEFFHRKKIIKL